ncbi:MAG TPA: type II toxin-antitoxin system VapB family antitoxin [Terriglobales bacterium]|nr:type II toxin-antitoxin system VapB family antitoxin [Terriglobales bacterium]
MRTHLELDDALLEQAVRLGGFSTKTAAVHAALTEYVKSQKRQALLRLRGRVRWNADLGQLRKLRVPADR